MERPFHAVADELRWPSGEKAVQCQGAGNFMNVGNAASMAIVYVCFTTVYSVMVYDSAHFGERSSLGRCQRNFQAWRRGNVEEIMLESRGMLVPFEPNILQSFTQFRIRPAFPRGHRALCTTSKAVLFQDGHRGDLLLQNFQKPEP